MPLPLMIVYRVLGVLFLALAAAALWEKYRTVRGGTLLPARILARGGSGGYRYVVEVYVDGERLECETNDSFWFCHDAQKGKSIRVWYRPGRPLLERHNPGTELMAAFMALAGIGLLLIR